MTHLCVSYGCSLYNNDKDMCNWYYRLVLITTNPVVFFFFYNTISKEVYKRVFNFHLIRGYQTLIITKDAFILLLFSFVILVILLEEIRDRNNLEINYTGERGRKMFTPLHGYSTNG